MLLNPHRSQHLLQAIPGTRLLYETFGLIGASFPDIYDGARAWTIMAVLAPVPGRALGGIRVRVEDQKGFTSFCNQRDLELLLGLARPGTVCPWLRTKYPEFDEVDFFGLCIDEEDLIDDLHERELRIRAETPGVLPFGMQLTRYLHLEYKRDAEELLMMLYDCDSESGLGPDQRLETVSNRWTRVERNRVEWQLHMM